MSQPNYNYYKNIFKSEKMPLAYIDLDLLDVNIEQILIRNQSKKKIRIHSKSIRSVSIINYIQKKSNLFEGVMCYTAEECLFLSKQGIDNILISYPTINRNQIKAICKELKKGKKIYFMVDLKEHVDILEEIAQIENTPIPVCVDMDMTSTYMGLYFGVYRSALSNQSKLERFVEYVDSTTWVKPKAIMGYEAQIAGLGDNHPKQGIKNRIIKVLQNRSASEVASKRKKAIDIFNKKGIHLDFVNGGGTGSIERTGLEDVVTEIAVGSGFYAPHLFDYYSHFKHLPAAGYAIEITRHPAPYIFTCLGGGYSASGSIEKNKSPLPYLPQGAELIAEEGAGEVQTPIKYKGKQTLKLGDPILMRHSKAGELCERFNELHLIRSGKISSIVPTYRGMGQCFL